MKHNKSIDWKQLYLELKTDGNLNLVEDLIRIDLKKLIGSVQNVKKGNKNYF